MIILIEMEKLVLLWSYLLRLTEDKFGENNIESTLHLQHNNTQCMCSV